MTDQDEHAAFARDLTDAIQEAFAADTEFAARAGERGADIVEDHELDLDPDDVVARMESAPYDDLDRRWNWTVGDICAESESCTDSRAYRVEGFGAVGPTGQW